MGGVADECDYNSEECSNGDPLVLEGMTLFGEEKFICCMMIDGYNYVIFVGLVSRVFMLFERVGYRWTITL